MRPTRFALLACATLGVLAPGCRPWDALDPRLGDGSAEDAGDGTHDTGIDAARDDGGLDGAIADAGGDVGLDAFVEDAEAPDAFSVDASAPLDASLDPTLGLVFHATMDVPTVVDTVSGLSASVTGTLDPVTGARGGALRFDGSAPADGASFAIGLDLGRTYTVSVWERQTEVAPNQGVMVSSTGAPVFQLRVENDERVSGRAYGAESGRWGDFDTIAGAGDTTCPDPDVLGFGVSPPEWAHIAFVVDDLVLRIYVNGALHETQTLCLTGPDGTATGGVVTLGHPTDFDGTSERYEGDLDDLRIYDRVLDLTEIERLATRP